ncbi:B-cell receptor CD22-like isoform X2 [Anguilla rostrata]|uniref:B-cell receptor CD22-like isoform X2 n=1 Tax=Anguilla rostrata TaxID=7938 RepID=UPI0030CB9EFE
MRCTYSCPPNYTVQKTFWFIYDWNSKQDSGDLSQSPEYSRRVEYLGDKYSDCTFRINQLRESDSRTYLFRVLTDLDGGHNGEPGVTLAVTDLQVMVNPDTVTEGQSVRLNCSTTCTLNGSPAFIWYRDGSPLPFTDQSHQFTASSEDAGRYSCAVTGYELHSPAVTLNVRCLKVDINSDTVSGGETVELTCRATCTRLGNSFIWYKNEQRLTDYYRFSQSYRILTFTARSGDTGRYSCAVRGNQHLVSPAVTLSVRCVKVEMKSSTVSEGVRVTLTCKITCTDLTGSQTFIWYKNGQYLSHTTQKYQNHDLQFIASSGDAGSYSCAIRGHENLLSTAVTLYPPKSTSVSVSPSGEIVEGSSVTLTCSSDANPPVQRYTWYKNNSAVSSETGGPEDSYTIKNITLQDAGEYYCEAQNAIGRKRSPPKRLDVQSALQVTVQGGQSLIAAAAVGVPAILALVFLGVVCVRRRKSRNETEGGRQGNKRPIYGNVSGMAMSHTGTQGHQHHP